MWHLTFEESDLAFPKWHLEIPKSDSVRVTMDYAIVVPLSVLLSTRVKVMPSAPGLSLRSI